MLIKILLVISIIVQTLATAYALRLVRATKVQKHGKVSFELVYLVMHPGYQEKNLNQIKQNLEILGIPATIFQNNIFQVADSSSQRRNDNPCYLGARMRRGALYDKAQSLGCNKIALGHHMRCV